MQISVKKMSPPLKGKPLLDIKLGPTHIPFTILISTPLSTFLFSSKNISLFCPLGPIETNH